MADLEKVIKGLECCMKWTGEPNTATCHCSDCSYTNMDILGQRCLIDLINDALALLKEQEAKTGHWIDTTKVIGFPRVQCSACGSGQGAIWMNYCPNCGAKMEGR